jgi:hypothetical protein
MRHRKALRNERPVRQAIAYLIGDLILIALACLSSERWITLLFAFLSVLAGIRAITLFASVIFHRDEFIEEEFVLRIGVPRH